MIGLIEGRAPWPLPEPDETIDVLADDDFQLALYCCYELHYRGFADGYLDMEWDPTLLQFRSRLEAAFECALCEAVGAGPSDTSVDWTLAALAEADSSPSLSAYMETAGTLEQFTELCIHRSAYQRKEADPHTWVIPRLDGEAKAALVEIQTAEYGNGRSSDMHSALFAETMEALGLDARYGHYVHALPGTTLATTNLISLFGLHRRWRGALVGHLALFEMTSCKPMARYARAAQRFGLPTSARRFYDEHVEIDVHHHEVALRRMVPAFVGDEPELAGDVVFGARALMALEARFTQHLLGCWQAGESSLRRP